MGRMDRRVVAMLIVVVASGVVLAFCLGVMIAIL